MADSIGGIPRLFLPSGEEKPDPLQPIARRLFPLVRSHPEWWREAVRRWANDPPLYGDDGILPVPFTEALTSDERIAMLAAIHDTYATEVARIDPWPSSELPPLDELADAIPGEYRIAIRYAILLRDRVAKLREHWDTHEAAIELFIAEATAKLDAGDGRAKLQAFAIALRLVGQKTTAIDAALRPIITEQQSEIDRLTAEYRDVVQRMESHWEAEFGEPYPKDIDDWYRWAWRAGFPSDRILKGDWKLSELFPCIEGYLLKLRDQHGSVEAQTKSRGDDPGENRMSWEEAAERMERLRQQGERFTSQPKLAEQFGCSSGTINKAIRNTESLHAWAKVSSATPKAQSINPVVTDNVPQATELSPEDDAAIREFLEREDITPDERAVFLAKSTADQIAFLNFLADDPDARDGTLHKRILGRKP